MILKPYLEEEKQTFPERLVAICDRITTYFGWNLEDETKAQEENGSRRITQSEELRKITYKAKSEALSNHALGITALYERIPQGSGYMAGFSDFIGFSNASDYTPENIARVGVLMKIIVDLKELYNDWQVEYKETLKFIAQNNIFNNKEVYVEPSILEAINKLVFEGRFKTYKYRDSGEVIHSNDKFHIGSVVGFSSDLSMWFQHIKNQSEFLATKPKDEVYVCLFGKLDELHPVYSNWIISMHKGDTIWIATDQMNFDNPYQKDARLGRRSVWRERGAVYDMCDLPYELFEDMDAIRAKQDKALAKNDSYIRHDVDEKFFEKKWSGDAEDKYSSWKKMFEEELFKLNVKFDVLTVDYKNQWAVLPTEMKAKREGRIVAVWTPHTIVVYLRPEFLFLNMSDLHDKQKAFLVLLTKELIDHASIMNDTYKTVVLGSEFMNMKMLEGAQVDPSQKTSMTYWDDDAKEIFHGILDTMEQNGQKTDALALKDFSLAFKHPQYDSSWLATPEKQNSLIEWTILDNERKVLESMIDELAKRQSEDTDALYEMMNDGFAAIRDRVMQSESIQLFIRGGYGAGFSNKQVPELRETGSVIYKVDKRADGYRGYGIGRDKRRVISFHHKDLCMNCGQYDAYTIKKINIEHYTELMWLLGLEKRTDLPKYFQNYRRHNFIPYGGNSLLDQTHPYLKLQDPCSRNHVNGMRFYFYMCGRCAKKLAPAKGILNLEIKGAEWRVITEPIENKRIKSVRIN